MSGEFQIGDRVTVARSFPNEELYVGDRGTIVGTQDNRLDNYLNYNGNYLVRWDKFPDKEKSTYPAWLVHVRDPIDDLIEAVE